MRKLIDATASGDLSEVGRLIASGTDVSAVNQERATLSATAALSIELVEAEDALFVKYSGQNDWQPAYIEIDPEVWVLRAGVNHDLGGAVTFDVWHDRVIRFPLPCPLLAEDANNVLETVAPLASRIAAGHKVRWDGNNMVGYLSEESAEACDALRHYLGSSNLTGDLDAWEAGDYIANCSDGDLELFDGIEDIELVRIAKCLVEDARGERIVIIGGADAMVRALEFRRNDLARSLRM